MNIIEFKEVSKTYNSFTAVDNITFSIKKGDIFALLGPNGAGKTTILKMLCGLIKPTSGMINVNTEHDDIRKVIGYMPEESAVYDDMSVVDYLKFFADLYKSSHDRITGLLEFLDLPDKQIAHLSKGMKRKVLLARSLINNPEILVYDEPASGLDPVIARNLLDHIMKLRQDGKTIVISAHDLTQIEEICDSLMILNKGRLDINGTIDEVKSKYGKQEYEIVYKNKKNRKFIDKKEMLKSLKCDRKIVDIQAREKSLQEIFIEKFKNV